MQGKVQVQFILVNTVIVHVNSLLYSVGLYEYLKSIYVKVSQFAEIAEGLYVS
jgi:hypothetical protein